MRLQLKEMIRFSAQSQQKITRVSLAFTLVVTIGKLTSPLIVWPLNSVIAIIHSILEKILELHME